MLVNFITQPYADGFDLQAFLTRGLRDSRYQRLDAAVAWAKRSGLRLISSELSQFQARGGAVRFVVGISEGGATAQGLQLVSQLATDAYIFHVPGRTFHSKVYSFSGEDAAMILVGSHNLTRGGLRANFEAGTLVQLDLTIEADGRFLADVQGYVDRLISDTNVCRRLEAATLAAVIRDPRYRIANEDSRRASSDSALGTNDRSGRLFGRSRHPLRSPTAPTQRPASTHSGTGGVAPQPGAPPAPAQPTGVFPPPAVAVVHRWFKDVPASDAQRLPGNSSPSGHLTLTQAGHPIDHATYFRQTFFGTARWRRVSANRERATIQVDVRILGRSFGRLALEVDHNPAFGAGQGNRRTTLRWGPLNGDLRHRVDIRGQCVTIEARADSTFGLTVTSVPTGPFIP